VVTKGAWVQSVFTLPPCVAQSPTFQIELYTPKQLTKREEKKNEKERKKNEAKNLLFWNIKTELNKDNPPPSFAVPTAASY
jgi:hypothetical protein